MSFEAFVNQDNVITLAGLKDVCTGDWENAATVEVTVTDKDGTDVTFDNTADDWPRPMPYVTGSNGNYCGVVPQEADLIAGTKYIAVITATASGIRGRWNVFFTAAQRNILR